MRRNVTSLFAALILLSFAAGACAAAADRIALPEPERAGGPSLLQSLSDRQSSRVFADADLTPQQLSNLLWAAAGVNRPDGKRTYPVTMGVQDMYAYVFIRGGVYKYVPQENALTLTAQGDHRAESGMQPFVGGAAVNIAYVQDLSAWKPFPQLAGKAPEFGLVHAGSMAQNAYLYAAAQGWSAVVRGSFDAAAVAKLLKLTDAQQVKLIQSVGPRP